MSETKETTNSTTTAPTTTTTTSNGSTDFKDKEETKKSNNSPNDPNTQSESVKDPNSEFSAVLANLQRQQQEYQKQLQAQRQKEEEENVPSLFIKSLPVTFTDEDLKTLFSAVGNVLLSKVIIDHNTGISKRHGFVKYGTMAESKAAIEGLNGFLILGKPISVEWSISEIRKPAVVPPPTVTQVSLPPSTISTIQSYAAATASSILQQQQHQPQLSDLTIFIKGLPKHIDDLELQSYMSSYGPISSVKILRDDQFISLGRAFVNFMLPDGAANALSLNGSYYPGTTQVVSVEYARLNTGAPKKSYGPVPTPRGKVLATSRYDPLAPSTQQQTQQQTQVMTNYQQQLPPEQQQQQQAPPISVIPHEPGPTVLFVASLPPRIDDESLHQLFASVGPVYAAKVIRDKASGISKGFGFVTMGTFEDATRAIQFFHGYIIDGKTIAVLYSENQ